MFDETVPDDDDDDEEEDEGLDEATAAAIAQFRLEIAQLEEALAERRNLLAEYLRATR